MAVDKIALSTLWQHYNMPRIVSPKNTNVQRHYGHIKPMMQKHYIDYR